MAIAFSILGILFFIFMWFASWLILVQNDEVQSVFIINVLSLIVLLVLQIQLISIGLAYSKGLSALVIFNGVYVSCWLFFNPYAKTIRSFMEHIGEKFSWVDPLLGDMSHNDLALRNVCSFSLSLLNLTYIHTSGGAFNIITLVLIGLGLLVNILIGLRLIKVSKSVKLHNGFMVHYCPLIMGLNFTSPSYCMSTIEMPDIDASQTGER